MDGATGLLIKLGVRLIVFAGVFFVVARKHPKVAIHARWATPLVALVFALLDTAVYWVLVPIFDLATLGTLGLIAPLVANVLLLVATVKFFAWDKIPHIKPDHKPMFEITGTFATLWLALILTAAHGALWFALDYLPNK
jgi:hypothetical protein